jgi:uncharacterized protein
MSTFLIIAAIVLVAGFVQSLTGFGFALMATPLLFLLMDPKTAIVLVVTIVSVNMLVLTITYWKDINKKRTVFMGIGSLIGVPLGTYILIILTPTAIKLAVASIIIVLSIFLLKNSTHYFKQFIPWHMAAGFLSGILTSSTSLGGPPSVLFLLSQNISKKEFLGTISVTGFILAAVTVGMFASMGLIKADILKTALISLPAMGIGFWIGSIVVKKINNQLFRYIAISVVILSAVVTIVTTIGHH